MKCIGAEKPPCVRCTKTGRFCVIPQSNQQPKTPTNIWHFPDSSLPCPPSTPQTPGFTPEAERRPIPEGGTWQSLKPPIYRNNTAPVPAPSPGFTPIPSPSQWPSSPLHPPTPRAQLGLSYTPVSSVYGHSREATTAWPVANGADGDAVEKVTLDKHRDNVLRNGPTSPRDEEVFHLSRFFITNLLHHIPVITERDLTDLGSTTKRPLAYCMAYVAAHYMPGCKAIRASLTSFVAPIARLQLERYDTNESTEESRWIQLQALSILYNWASSSHHASGRPGISDNVPVELRHDMLQASMETLARRHSLHRSPADVTELAKRNVQNIQESFAFRNCLCWLWLFSEAHFRALISQNPPSIREDSSIVQGAQLLHNIADDECARKILTRVELCLLWSRPAFREHNLSEWWCSIQTISSLEPLLALLDELDTVTQSCHQKWHLAEQASHTENATRAGQDETTGFYYHFTCFCIGNYIARAIQSSTAAESLPLSRIHTFTKTIDRGNQLCRFFLELSPLAKYSVCFSPEIVYAMMASCCESLLQVFNAISDASINKSVHRSTIRQVADLMADLSIDERQGAKGRGQHLMARLRENETVRRPATATAMPQRPTAHHKRSMTWTGEGGDQQAAQALLSFVPATDDALSMPQIFNQPHLANGQQQGFDSGPSDGLGIWTPYHASPPVGSADAYWTS